MAPEQAKHAGRPLANQSTSQPNGSTASTKKAPLTDEQKRRLGKELAYTRVNKVLNLLDKVGNLGRYGLTDEEKTKIINAVGQHYDTMKANINQKVVKKEGFTL